jgi:hypothetical protein
MPKRELAEAASKSLASKGKDKTFRPATSSGPDVSGPNTPSDEHGEVGKRVSVSPAGMQQQKKIKSRTKFPPTAKQRPGKMGPDTPDPRQSDPQVRASPRKSPRLFSGSGSSSSSGASSAPSAEKQKTRPSPPRASPRPKIAGKRPVQFDSPCEASDPNKWQITPKGGLQRTPARGAEPERNP